MGWFWVFLFLFFLGVKEGVFFGEFWDFFGGRGGRGVGSVLDVV